MRLLTFLTFIIFFFFCNGLFSQQLLKGVISDERGIPIPYAKIYVKNSAELRTLADVDGYFEMRLYQGEYFLVITSTGYEDTEAYVTISDSPVSKNYTLLPSAIQDIEAVDASANKSNPGREIMLEVVRKRDQINPWNYPHTVNGYIKAAEKIDRKEKEDDKNEKKKTKKIELNQIDEIEDPFSEQRKEDKKLANNMNLVEVDFVRHYGPNGEVKEIRNGYELRGNEYNRLYYTTTVKSNFNFFENLLYLDDLHQTPVSSPISGPGILSYKYRLEKQYEENGQIIDKIKIIPRNIATTTLEGYIYVIDSLWLVQKLELTMEKGNLLIYDYFQINQEFIQQGDTLSVLKKQTLDYGVKYSNEASNCTTVASFSDYNFNPKFTPKFFNSELSITEQEAYDKDSTFWKEKRKTELSPEETKYIAVKDSIYDYENRPEYLDSVDREFNKITALKVLIFGIDHRNREKMTQWTILPVASLIRPIYIAGPRIGTGFYYYKKWDSGRYIDCFTDVSVGFKNGDPKGSTDWTYLYNPFHRGRIRGNFSHEFDVIRGYDAITQIYRRNNFIEATSLTVGHDYEIANGLYLETDLSMTERRTLDGYEFVHLLDSVLPNDEPTDFETYQAFIFDATLRFTPFQKYMREPTRKVVLGSRWPTFYVYYEKGLPTIFGSDVDHDYLRVGIEQTFKIGTLGTSNYHILSGTFLNNKVVKDADQKYHRRSDPIWFSNPLNSFQGLDSTLPSEKIYLEGHFVHHDNGALLSKIPFMKKTRIGLVMGVGALYVHEFKWQHYEVLAGLERNFKFAKRLLRIGFYGALSYGNHIQTIKPTWKVSFAILDNRNLKWNF